MEGFSGLAGEPSAPSRHVRGDDRPARAEHRRVHRGRQHGDRRLRRSRARPDAAHPRLARLRSDHRRRRGQRPPAQRVDLPRRQGPAAFARAADHDLAVARLRVRRDREGCSTARRRSAMRSASPSIGCATVAASAIRSSTRPTGSRSNARIRRSSASTAIRSLHPTRASASSTAPRSANCSRGRSKRARRSNTASCRWPNCAKPTICS